MSVYAVEYVYEPGSEEGRSENRADHRALLASLTDIENVKLVASGPYTDGSGALLLFAAASEDKLRDVLAQDPFNNLGFVKNLRVTEWEPVTGELSQYA